MWSDGVFQSNIKLQTVEYEENQLSLETCYEWEVKSHIQVMKFSMFCPVCLLSPSAHFTDFLFCQEDVYVCGLGPWTSDGIYMNEWQE